MSWQSYFLGVAYIMAGLGLARAVDPSDWFDYAYLVLAWPVAFGLSISEILSADMCKIPGVMS